MNRFISCAILLFVILTGGLFFFFKKGKNNESKPTEGVSQRKIVNPDLQVFRSLKLKNAAYRLLPAGDSIIICTDTSVLMMGMDLNGGYEVPILPELKSQILYYYKNGFATAGLSFGTGKVFYSDSNLNFVEKISNGYGANAIFIKDTFFCNNLYLEKENKIFIERIDLHKKKWELSLDIKQFVSSEITHCKACLENTLEGNFFKIDSASFGYFFYRGGYVLIYRNGKYALERTLIKHPFMEFKQVEANLNGMKAFPCQPEKDIYVQLSVCAYGERVFILSNIADDKKKRTVDVYRVSDLTYEKSFYLDKYNDQLPEMILVPNKSKIIVTYDKGTVVCYDMYI